MGRAYLKATSLRVEGVLTKTNEYCYMSISMNHEILDDLFYLAIPCTFYIFSLSQKPANMMKLCRGTEHDNMWL